MNSYSKTKVKSGGNCGCGGSKGGSPSSHCACGGTGCATCKGQGYARPNFFAGQLLTEEDLQQLSDYVAAKNRLHNRHLFGEGVVCGLDVACHPCGEGKVIVHPGYALDCCGNDLVLACEQTLDINGMIRDLRINKRGGLDCGDPCKDKESKKAHDPATSAAATAEPAKDKPEEATRHYCLYINYCEELSDPVSPYSTGDACNSVTCQPTRVREGVSFELRCREQKHPRSSFACNLMECLDEVIGQESRITNSRAVQAFANRYSPLEKRDSVDVVDFTTTQAADMINATEHLNKQLREIADMPGDEEIVWSVVETTRNLASLVARHHVFEALNPVNPPPPAPPTEPGQPTTPIERPDEGEARPPERAAEILDRQAVANNAMDAMRQLKEVRTKLSDKVQKAIPLEIDKEYANALFDVINEIENRPPSDNVQLLAYGDVSTPAFNIRITEVMEEMRERLLDKLEQSMHLSDCSLPRELASLDLASTVPAENNRRTALRRLKRGSAKLRDIQKRYLINCICSALIPPCSPCEDTGVLLACLEVKDCDIVRVCNLERTFVISPTAVRYWVPLQLLGEEIEALCCVQPTCEDNPGDETITSVETRGFRYSASISQNLFGLSGGVKQFEFEELIAIALAKLCGTEEDVRRYAHIIREIGGLFARPSRNPLTRKTISGIEAPNRLEADEPQPVVAAQVNEGAIQDAVNDFLNRATFDETTEFGRSVLAKLDALVQERLAAQPTRSGRTRSGRSQSR
ncbi:MAG TPA: hypothetical protein VF131_26770 [Blastocatellia bacterium]|nr:hypothetical protein [Blastocatellia bacterium]